MEQYSESLDDIFQALADPTRRAVLGALAKGPTSISELAAPFEMALPSFMKHIHQLEASGWIVTQKLGRVRSCSLEKKALRAADAWLATQRSIWEARTDRLERFVTSGPRRGRKNTQKHQDE